MWFDEVKKAAITPEKIEKVYADIRSHNLPVVVYGAAQTAERVTNALNKRSIEVANYAVDDEYFTPNKTHLGKPVLSISDFIIPPGGGAIFMRPWNRCAIL